MRRTVILFLVLFGGGSVLSFLLGYLLRAHGWVVGWGWYNVICGLVLWGWILGGFYFTERRRLKKIENKENSP